MTGISARRKHASRFWDNAKPRLERLSNRLDPKTIRLRVHQRIPWPMQAERDLAEARSDFRFWHDAHGADQKIIEANEQAVARLNEQNAELREQMHKNAMFAARGRASSQASIAHD
jgi:hypothetical protein